MHQPNPRIVWEIAPNPQYLRFNVNIPIACTNEELFDFPLCMSDDDCVKKVGLIGAALVRKIDSILGCESMCLKQYSVRVRIGEAFDPYADGIIDAVIEVLKDCFGDKRDEDVKVVTKDNFDLYRESASEFATQPTLGGS